MRKGRDIEMLIYLSAPPQALAREQLCFCKDMGPSLLQQVVERTRGCTSRQGVIEQGAAASIYIHEKNSKDGNKNVNVVIQSVMNRPW